MERTIDDLIAQLEGTKLNSEYHSLNFDRFTQISKSLEHCSSALALAKKENASSLVSEKTNEINNLLNILVHEARNISGPSLRKRYSSISLDILISFRNLIKTEEDINSFVGAVWGACRELLNAPKSNCEQVAVLLSYVSDMLKDAFDEVEQLSKGISFDGDILSLDESTSTYFSNSKLLVKFCILCVQKLQTFFNTCVEDETMIMESEEILILGNDLSARVDDFVSTLDIPLQVEDPFLSDSLTQIFELTKNLISSIESKGSNVKWISLAKMQINKLESLLVGEMHTVSR